MLLYLIDPDDDTQSLWMIQVQNYSLTVCVLNFSFDNFSGVVFTDTDVIVVNASQSVRDLDVTIVVLYPTNSSTDASATVLPKAALRGKQIINLWSANAISNKFLQDLPRELLISLW